MTTDPDPIAKSLAVAATTIQQYKQSPSSKRALYLVQAAQRALDRAKTVEQCKDIHDALRVLEIYSKLRQDDWKTGQAITMQRLITEWKMGGILRESVNHEGGRPGKRYLASTVLPPGITKNDSSSWQRMAEFDQDAFETMMKEAFASEELSTSWAVRQWQKLFGHVSHHEQDGEDEGNGHHGPPPPENFEEDQLYPDRGSRMRAMLDDCQNGLGQIACLAKQKPIQPELIIDICADLEQSIINLFEEMR